MNTARPMFLVLSMAFSTACAGASMGRFDATHVADLAPGRTTRADALRWFGEPADVERADRAARPGACTEVLHWSNSTRDTVENLAVSFDADGVECGHTHGGPRRRQSVEGRISRLASRRPR